MLLFLNSIYSILPQPNTANLRPLACKNTVDLNSILSGIRSVQTSIQCSKLVHSVQTGDVQHVVICVDAEMIIRGDGGGGPGSEIIKLFPCSTQLSMIV